MQKIRTLVISMVTLAAPVASSSSKPPRSDTDERTDVERPPLPPGEGVMKLVVRNFLLTAAAVVVADLATKTMAHRGMATWVIQPGHNPGLALGLIDISTTPELALMALGLLGSGWWTLTRALAGRGRVATASFLVGGAAANLTDRILFGSVRDFLATPWLVFNLADLSLLVGVILLYSDLLAGRRQASPVED